MKKLFLLICSVALMHTTRADEGMWIPSLIGKNYEEMQRLGLKLSKEDLYSINHSSIKDAIVHFGGGCTAEMISANGLLLTNHHCGYDAIATLSSVQKNYLDNGYFAKSLEEELPAEGLSVLFLQSIEDVTDEMNAAVGRAKGDKATERLEAARKKIEEAAAEKGKYVANVKEYFNGNQYLLLIYKKYTDVRFVAAPPKSLGKFGGDTDNWMWPRHTADFSMFRVYANDHNEPAPYSPKNIPYQPKKFLPISIQGEKEKDYAMIFGYPGRTNRYEVAAGLELALKEVNPSIVSIRDTRLGIIKKHMNADKNVYLKMTSQYARIANYWKYYIGQSEQLKRLNVVDLKKQQEKEFTRWSKANDAGYNYLIKDYSAAYNNYRPYAKHATYYGECFKGSAMARMASAVAPLEKVLVNTPEPDSITKYVKVLQAVYKSNMKEYDEATDKELFAAMAKMYYENVPKNQLPDIYQAVIFKKYGSDNSDNAIQSYTDQVYEKSLFSDSTAFAAFCKKPDLKTIDNDPSIQFALSFVHNFETYYQPKIDEFAKAKRSLSKQYVAGLMEMNENKMLYPDANSTMRITYGQVLAYQPQDAVSYNYFTTIDGLIAKYKPGSDEFDVPEDLIKLYKKKDYGVYADADGSLHTCFITNNDITGGNSGSPVINANGELIGAAFDGNWEAMSGDIAFDKKYKRTIVADIRFILFLVDKMGGASNLIKEMDIR